MCAWDNVSKEIILKMNLFVDKILCAVHTDCFFFCKWLHGKRWQGKKIINCVSLHKRAKVFETHIHKHYSLGVPFSDTNTFLSLLWCWDNCLLLFLRLCVCYKSVLFWNGLYSAVCWTLGVRKRTCFCTASAIECMESWRWIVMAAKLALLLTSLSFLKQCQALKTPILSFLLSIHSALKHSSTIWCFAFSSFEIIALF